jgi:hypothetical protein
MDIIIKFKGKEKPSHYNNVDEFYETRKGIKFVQHSLYSTITTFVYHDAIEYFEKITH